MLSSLLEVQCTTASLVKLKTRKMWITKTFLLFTLLFTISEQAHAQCGSREWTSVTRTKIGSTQFRNTGTEAFDIPSVIPSSAKEVLVLADMQTGYSGPNDVISYVKIYTKRSSRNFEKYIVLRSYHQSAWSVNSDNLWFPMTTGRKVYVESAKAHTQNLVLNLHAIGYR